MIGASMSLIGRAIGAAALCSVVAVNAQAGVTFHWDFQVANTEVGRDGAALDSDDAVTVWDETYQEWITETCSEAVDVGEAYADMVTWTSTDPVSGIASVGIEAAVELITFAPTGAEPTYTHGYAYFQLVATISDQPYTMELDAELDVIDEADFWITNNDHFVNSYDPSLTLQPSIDPYVLVWGAINYDCLIDFKTGDDHCGYAETIVGLNLIPVPEPVSLSLLAVSGLTLLQRRRMA